MPNTLSLSFGGLCAFVDRTDAVEAYLLFGHGEHGANLVIPSDALLITDVTWVPDWVGFFPESSAAGATPRQFSMWNLHGEEVSVVDTSVAAGLPTWNDRATLIDFDRWHPASTTLSKTAIQANESRVGVIRLVGQGSQIAPLGTAEALELFKNGVSIGVGDFPPMAQWTSQGAVTIQNRVGEVIALKPQASWGVIANNAAVPPLEGLSHFHHYYEGVTLAAGDSPMTIENRFTSVWDCVPVVVWRG